MYRRREYDIQCKTAVGSEWWCGGCRETNEAKREWWAVGVGHRIGRALKTHAGAARAKTLAPAPWKPKESTLKSQRLNKATCDLCAFYVKIRKKWEW